MSNEITTAESAGEVTKYEPQFQSNLAQFQDINQGTVAIEASRAIAEAQGKLVIAKRFPRDEIKSYARVMQACKRKGIAEKAFYSYSRGSGVVSGPTIRFAEELARCWGNIDYGIKELSQSDTTEKQAMAAAILLTADALATEWLFQDGKALTVLEIGEFLKTKDAVSLSERGYDILCDWVAVNSNKLRGYSETGDCYGVVEDGIAYIIRSVFNRVCMENGLSPKALLSQLRCKNLIITSKGFTKSKYIGNGQSPHCVWMRLPGSAEKQESELLP